MLCHNFKNRIHMSILKWRNKWKVPIPAAGLGRCLNRDQNKQLSLTYGYEWGLMRHGSESWLQSQHHVTSE